MDILNLLVKSFGFSLSRRKMKPKIELAGKQFQREQSELLIQALLLICSIFINNILIKVGICICKMQYIYLKVE